ncbi:carbonic anhydrase [Halovivax gelatinilyticus]|uniref:carbonic anhydrase n=1 Tax=Halovivax gelatinilyticus TaxID=2961597 RepID=UPI0020CA7A92|nr:carbonic anhydrase [Halovivax gelatinilyticus]
MEGDLESLLEGNAAHVESLSDDYFETIRTGQQPSVVSMCCSDSRVSQEGMWNVDRPGAVFTPSNIGNQVWDADVGERIVDGSVLYPIHHCGTRTIAVVGHTGCGAVSAAYDVACGAEAPRPIGVTKWVELLVPVIEEGLADERVDADPDGTPRDADETTVRNQLVEYNVDAQVDFLLEAPEVPEDVSIYGFVYDFHGAYGNDPGRTYLVNRNGATDPEDIRDGLDPAYHDAVESLLAF